MMADEERRMECWYVSASNKNAFTSDPKMAAVDWTGTPILGSGFVRKLIKRQEKAERNRIGVVWEMLLDAMEEIEKFHHSDPTYTSPMYRERYGHLLGEVAGIERALCALAYSAEYEEDINEALRLVRSEAERRYDESAAAE